MNEYETIADIIAWLRRPREGENAYLTAWRNEIADRFEAAIKREKAAIEADALAVGGIVEAERKRERGDCAKLREAVEESRRIASDLSGCRLNDYWKLNEIVRFCEAALAAPARNCDVGTAKEQTKRFAEYCDSEACRRNRCKSQAKALCIERCALAWAQSPYEKGGAK